MAIKPKMKMTYVEHTLIELNIHFDINIPHLPLTMNVASYRIYICHGNQISNVAETQPSQTV